MENSHITKSLNILKKKKCNSHDIVLVKLQHVKISMLILYWRLCSLHSNMPYTNTVKLETRKSLFLKKIKALSPLIEFNMCLIKIYIFS